MSNKSEVVEWGWGLGKKQYLKNIFVNYAQLTKENLWSIFQRQNGCCATCGVALAWPLEKKDKWGEPFEIDHLHVEGERRCSHKKYVRGLLCQGCNKALRECTKRVIPEPLKSKLEAYVKTHLGGLV